MLREVDLNSASAAASEAATMHAAYFTLRHLYTRKRRCGRYYKSHGRAAIAAIARKEADMAEFATHGHSICRTLALALCCAGLAACASGVSTSSSAMPHALVAKVERESTEARAKRVFMYESRVADALLDRYPLREDFAAAAPRLVMAEARMTEDCGALTRAVVRSLEGREQSIKQRLRVARSLDACERAARQLQALVDQPPSDSLIATGGP